MLRAPRRPGGRAGFTLIELLVVIAIIAVLASLSAVAAFRLIGSQQSHNTKSELTALETVFQKQYRAAADKFRKEPIPIPGSPLGNVYYNYVYNPQTGAGMAGGDPLRAQVIWTKLRLKQTFPNNFNEALNPAPMQPLPYYQNALGQLGYTAANTATPQPWESAVCLLLALQRGEDNTGVKMEDLGVSSFITDFGPTPNSQTVKGLVDGWHNPIVFSRWPVNSTVLNPNGQPQPGNKNDPDDPSGLLVSTAWQTVPSPANYTQFQTYCHAVPAHANGAEASTYRIYPLIASAGPDGLLGLNPITFQATNTSQAADNLYPTLAPPSQ